MADQREVTLFDYYQQELIYLHKMGATFADRYPSVAGRLALSDHHSADPHVERLLEAFAFLTARIQYNIDQEFPQIPAALLDILYPQLQAPIPSMTIAHFEVDPAQASNLLSGSNVECGTPLYAKTHDGPLCWYRTCYPVTLWPLQVADAKLWLLDAGRLLLGLQLRALPGASLNKVAADSLRFYLRGDHVLFSLLYELLFCTSRRVSVRPATTIGLPQQPLNLLALSQLPAGSLAPVGFGPDEAVLPYPAHTHPGHRLLQEFFAFPEKFDFFEVRNLDLRQYGPDVAAFEIYIDLDAARSGAQRHQLERLAATIGPGAFCLGCTPAINLFTRTSEPIRLDHRQSEYPLSPDLSARRTTEVYSIQRVTAVSARGTEVRTIAPLFGFDFDSQRRNQKVFWHARRRPYVDPSIPGSEMVLALLDLAFNPAVPDAQTVYAETLCTNRDLAQYLPPGARLQIEQATPVRQIVCLGKPTPQRHAPLPSAALWRLVSQLALNHLSLGESDQFGVDKRYACDLDGGSVPTGLRADLRRRGLLLSPKVVVARRAGSRQGARTWTIQDNERGLTLDVVEETIRLAVSSAGEESLEALREILRLHALADDPAAPLRALDGLGDLRCRRLVRRAGNDLWGGFAPGLEISLTFDEEFFQGRSPFLLAAVLNHFFSLYVSANLFTQFVAFKKQVEGEWKRWQPMAGGQPVL